ncbi:hypothetical protein C7S16_3871 [Burkholderia thailandensis]|uniref:Uncharacterized protein n=1 Tax=Burkholderia thailandensis TaxID=57975 RepID=A0AAW9CUF3_BURTH|nr:hypothetical protein [Burkholderia thailandensis]
MRRAPFGQAARGDETKGRAAARPDRISEAGIQLCGRFSRAAAFFFERRRAG